MSKISLEEVKHVAHLARLHLTEEEMVSYQTELEKILVLMDQLNELDTEQVEPTTRVIKQFNVLREDIPSKGLSQEEVLKNAPSHQDGQIKVPSIMD